VGIGVGIGEIAAVASVKLAKHSKKDSLRFSSN